MMHFHFTVSIVNLKVCNFFVRFFVAEMDFEAMIVADYPMPV